VTLRTTGFRFVTLGALVALTACAARVAAPPPAVAAIRYRIEVVEGTFDIVRGFTRWIDEIYLPEHGVACNLEWLPRVADNGEVDLMNDVPRLRAFFVPASRLDTVTDRRDVQLPRELAQHIVDVASKRKDVASQLVARGLLPAPDHGVTEPVSNPSPGVNR